MYKRQHHTGGRRAGRAQQRRLRAAQLGVDDRTDRAGDDACLFYTSDAADERSRVDLGGRRIIKKNNTKKKKTRRRQLKKNNIGR